MNSHVKVGNKLVVRGQSRRTFLRRSTLGVVFAPAVGGCFGLTSILRSSAAVGANDKIRLGVIGCGGMGRGDLATFLMYGLVDCPVVCDVDDKAMVKAAEIVQQKRGNKPEMIKDFRRLLERKDIDAVLVATPDHWHALPTVLACQAGKDVYVEKPLATSIAEGRAMLEASRRHERIVQMGTQRRSSDFYREPLDLVRSGKLGKVGLVRAWAYLDWVGNIGNPADTEPPAGVDYDLWLGPAPKRPFNPNRFHFNFRWFWDYAGGLMTDWGVHLIDVLLMGMGMMQPKSVSATGGKYVLTDNTETPDTQIAVYEFPNYTLVWEHKVGLGVGLNGRPWGMSFSGSEGTLIINDSEWEIIPEHRKANLEPVKKRGGSDPRPAHVKNFLDCMRSRQAPVDNLEVGHFVSTVAHLGNIALRCGRKIVWDAPAEQVVGDAEANRLVTVQYRPPWKLPYLPATV